MKFGFLLRLPRERLQKVVLVCIVTLSAVVGVVELYVVDNWKALRAAKSRIATLNDQIQQAENLARQAVRDETYRGQVKSFVQTQQEAMITGDPFAWVVREISLLAEKHPVHVVGLHAGGKIELIGNTKFQTYTSRIELTGTYDQLGEFIRDLENRFPTGEIRTLSVSGSAGDKGQHQAGLDLVLRIRPDEPSKNVEAKKTS